MPLTCDMFLWMTASVSQLLDESGIDRCWYVPLRDRLGYTFTAFASLSVASSLPAASAVVDD